MSTTLTDIIIVMIVAVVVTLIFGTLGLEMSFKRMARLARVLFVAGPLQVILTGSAAAGVGFALGLSTAEAIVLGMLAALSSTAVVLKTTASAVEGRDAVPCPVEEDRPAD
jgi:CPA2 family monovalent cation:H+ antiporter-2